MYVPRSKKAPIYVNASTTSESVTVIFKGGCQEDIEITVDELYKYCGGFYFCIQVGCEEGEVSLDVGTYTVCVFDEDENLIEKIKIKII